MISQTTYQGLDAWALENDHIKITLLPQYGGKMVHLLDKSIDYNWLFTRKDTLTLPHYDADFAAFDCSGFDEIFPGIDAGLHPNNGKSIPDHGEVWALPWQCRHDGDSLVFSVHSEVFNYTLERRVRLEAQGVLLEYRVTNHTGEDFPFIWTPHALLKLNQHSQIKVPTHLDKIVSVGDGSGELGPWGTQYAFPKAHSDNTQREINLHHVWGTKDNNCDKYYFCAPLQEGWCEALQPELGRKLRFEFPVEKVPYLGLWKTQGGFKGDYNFALEPCTGLFDDVYVANRTGHIQSVPANGEYTWFLRFSSDTLAS